MQISTTLLNEEDSIKFARRFAETLKSGDVILFYGDLGSGKTFLCREIIRYFCGSNTDIISPTFNLLQTYQTPDFTIYHFDLYRLKSAEEIYELGIEEALGNNLCLIEWPALIEDILPKHFIKVTLEIIDEKQRLCRVR